MKRGRRNLAHTMTHLAKRVAAAYHSIYFPPAMICVAILVATVFGWRTAQLSLEQDITNAAMVRIKTAEQTMQEHIVAYEQILRGGVGLFQGSDAVTQQDWQNYLDAFDIPTKYTGVLGIGFAQVFGADELEQAQRYVAGQGENDFTAWSEGTQDTDTYAIALYVQTPTGQRSPLYGLDLYSNTEQRSSMLRARDSGIISISQYGRLPPQADSPMGFTMYAPYYDVSMPTTTPAERQAALRGYVFVATQAEAFFQDTFTGVDDQAAGFYAIVASQTVYESPLYRMIDSQRQALHIVRPLRVFDQTWTLRFAINPEMLISPVLLRRPANVLFFGIFSALLISTVIFLLLRSRSRDLTAQKDRAVELAKDELLSLASHQLRTPATGVKQYVGMVLQGFAGKVPKMQQELLEKAYASNDRQLRIINEILHLAKIDAGRIVLAKQNTNLSELISDIVAEQQPDIVAANHTVKVALPKKPIALQVDVHMLRMAIENVLSNAIKYTPNGGRIEIRLSRELTSAIISVIDTGVGIKPNDTDKIFRQFSRLPNPMSQQVGGTGIGLYLAKYLIELHKGSIRVESVPGTGSIFIIRLPLVNHPIKNLTVRPKT